MRHLCVKGTHCLYWTFGSAPPSIGIVACFQACCCVAARAASLHCDTSLAQVHSGAGVDVIWEDCPHLSMILQLGWPAAEQIF